MPESAPAPPPPAYNPALMQAPPVQGNVAAPADTGNAGGGAKANPLTASGMDTLHNVM